MMKKLIAVLAVSLPLAAAAQAPALKFKLSGDLNHRFAWTNQSAFFGNTESIRSSVVVDPLKRDTLEEFWGEFKYRLTLEAGAEDGSVRGVYGLEIGAIRFGNSAQRNVPGTSDAFATNGGGYSGDGDNYETRWAYIDFGLPTARKNRVQVGLLPFVANKWLWAENATGVQLKGDFAPVSYTLAWMRGAEIFNTSRTDQEFYADGDSYFLRGDLAPSKDMKAGVFGLYTHRNSEGINAALAAPGFNSYRIRDLTGQDFDIFYVGVDGALTFGNIFVNADAIYQFGKMLIGGTSPIRNQDVNGFFVHADVGANFGPAKVTLTSWYASGDKNPGDGEVENYMPVDVNVFDSIIFHQGGYTDDTYFTNSPVFGRNGAIFNKLALDFKASPKVTVGAAAVYAMLAEELTTGVTNQKEDVLGTAIEAYISYKVTPNVELALNGGYLIPGDAMDFWEAEGAAGPADNNAQADADVGRVTARMRYTF